MYKGLFFNAVPRIQQDRQRPSAKTLLSPLFAIFGDIASLIGQLNAGFCLGARVKKLKY